MIKIMSNKYKSGNLFVVYFDNYGTKINENQVTNYMDGRNEIREYLSEHKDRSCAMRRVIFNSKDSHNMVD